MFLKLVKPGDSIENAIIQQTPILEGLHVKQDQLTGILETFGNKCLLILDGLDEHAGGQNGDVFQIVKCQKFPRCHVLVTSRPHSTIHLERYFTNIVCVHGFSLREAEKFAHKILKDDTLVAHVLAFNPGDFDENIALHNCPIFTFIHVLVNERRSNRFIKCHN